MAGSPNRSETSRDRSSVTPWVLGAWVLLAIALMMVVWLPGSPTSQTATQNHKSPIAKTPDQPTPPFKPQPR
jgi:hypothetical protein